MLNYDKDQKDIQILKEIGVPFHEMNGYSVIEGEEFILREYHTNRREQGHEVPEKYQPTTTPRKEREIKYQSKMMADLESERVDRELESGPDKWMWVDDEDIVYDEYEKEWIPIWIMAERNIERKKQARLDKIQRLKEEREERQIRVWKQQFRRMMKLKEIRIAKEKCFKERKKARAKLLKERRMRWENKRKAVA